MDSLIKDIRFGVRGLLKHPSFTAIAVITLALGIGANTAIFSVLYAVLLRPLPYPDSDRVVRIDETEGRGGMGVSPPNFVDFQQQNQSFENIAAYSGGSFILTGGSQPLRIQSATVSPNLFSLLKVNPLIGRTFSATDENESQNRVAILAHGLWQQRFGGDEKVVGTQIDLDGDTYTVIAVMSPDFEFPIQTDPVEVWVPLSLPADLSTLRGAHYLDVVGRLKPDVSLAAAHKDLEVIASRLAQQFPDQVPGRTRVVPLKKALVGEVQPYLLMLAVAVVLVLLIATANVASLMLARAEERRKEIALRFALGATRLHLLRQLLTESLTLSFLGGIGALLLVTWGTKVLISLGPADLPRLQSARFNIPVFLFALGASLISGILFGLAPWLSAGPDLQSTLQEGDVRSATGARQTWRKTLVISEITLALVLLCGAGLLVRTLWNLNAVRPGFDPEQILVAEVVLPKTKYPDQNRQAAFFQQLQERIKALPNVESVGGTTNLPMSGTNMVFLASVEGTKDRSFPASFRSISGDYFPAMRVPLLRGRSFDERDIASSPAVVVINESMARQIAPNGDAIGKRIKHGFKKQVAEVVGIVGDVKFAGLDKETRPEMYAPFAQGPWPFLRLVVRAKTDPQNLAGAIRGATQSIDKDQPVDKIATMRSLVNSSIAPRRFYMQLLGSFAGMAFILAAIGIYGLVSYSVAQRTREIGIRMALGAKRNDVLRLVLSEGFKLTIIGLVLGLLGAFAATKVLRNLLFEVRPTDPFTFITVSLSLVVVALLACYIPARRATKVDPLEALRYE